MSRLNETNILQARPLPTPEQLLTELPMSDDDRSFVQKVRTEIINILNGKDHRHLLIVGPCSIHDVEAAKEFAKNLKELAEEVKDTFLVLMRVYFEKPRTVLGWKGLLFDPFLDNTHQVEKGIRITRQLLIELTKDSVACAAEFLDPSSAYYFGDLISWGCIGARTAESQTHREIASGLPMPVGFKNNTDGNPKIAINGVLAAKASHTFIGFNRQGQASVIHTKGNPDCHVVLRGGENGPNYDPKSISLALHSLKQMKLPERLIIDCSHDNSNHKHEKQIQVFQSVISQIIEGNTQIKGLAIESNLYSGNQDHRFGMLKYGVSITDACLDWETTQQMIRWGCEKLSTSKREQEENQLTESFHDTTIICN